MITDWSYAKYICGSSLFFQIPALYAYRHKKYTIAASSVITTALSINHWRHPTHTSWRRRIDVAWVRIVVPLCFTYSLQYTYIGIPATSLMAWMYHRACLSYENNPLGNWYLYHMLFHAISSTTQCLLVYVSL